MKWLGKLRSVLRPAEREAAVSAAPDAPQGDRLSGLTRREREVYALLLQGKKQREIADSLSVRPTTVSFHIQSLYRKLGIHDRAQLFIQYAQPGKQQQEANIEEES